MISNSSYKTDFLPEFLLTNRQVANLCKDLSNNSSFNVKSLKTQFSKIVPSEGTINSRIPC